MGAPRAPSPYDGRGWGLSDGESLRERLLSAREVAGLSLEATATSVGIDSWRLEQAEAGEFDPPCTKVIRLAELFGVTMDWLGGRVASPWETYEPRRR